MYAHTPTHEMEDAARNGRFHTAPGLQHAIAMHLLALEWAEEVLIERFAGERGPREVAAEAKARLRQRALARSYPAPPAAVAQPMRRAA